MKLVIYSALYGVLVSICGFSVMRDWQAWALIAAFGVACAWPPRRSEP